MIGDGAEIWRDIPGYEDLYWASSWGRIRGAKGIKNLREHVGRWGKYLKLDLWKNNKRRTVRVQRIVLSAFHGVPKAKDVSRHMDGNTFHNAISNLLWGTQKENKQDEKDRAYA